MSRNSKTTQVLAAREAGVVRRCHALPHHGQYNIAQHSYGAVALLLLLHPNPTMNLVRAVMFHDLAERWLGDVPAPGKWSNSELGAVYAQTEDKLLMSTGMVPELTEEEELWLKAVDTLDLWLWCREEAYLGNRAVGQMLEACENTIRNRHLEGLFPSEAWVFFVGMPEDHYRLSDFFGQVKDSL